MVACEIVSNKYERTKGHLTSFLYSLLISVCFFSFLDSSTIIRFHVINFIHECYLSAYLYVKVHSILSYQLAKVLMNKSRFVDICFDACVNYSLSWIYHIVHLRTSEMDRVRVISHFNINLSYHRTLWEDTAEGLLPRSKKYTRTHTHNIE